MKISNLKDCCGCGACASVCSFGAISLEDDFKGFKYPKVDNTKCINCGACMKVCPFLNSRTEENNNKYYIFRMENDDIINSQSGGFFNSLSENILLENGDVCGCVLDNDLLVKHLYSNDKKIVNKMRKSKYVQSDFSSMFKRVKENLALGKKVLVSGTPCQIQAIYNYLSFYKCKMDNLITCDIICHGVNSPALFKGYLSIIESRENNRIVDVDFRSKYLGGWHSHNETIYFENGTNIVCHEWRDNFYKDIMFRPSCYQCKFTRINRVSDFTIGDAWGIGKINKNLDDNKGMSFVIIHNKKAYDIFKRINGFKQEIDYTKILQPQLIHPVCMPKNYYSYWGLYKRNPRRFFKKIFFKSKIKILFENIHSKINYYKNRIKNRIRRKK